VNSKSRYLLVIAFAVAMVGGVLTYRWQAFDKAGLALKEGNGALAIQELQMLAYFGDKEAQSALGSIYAYGWGGVSRNFAIATYWFRRCGECNGVENHGEVDAASPHQLIVGKSYLDGSDGVVKDELEGYRWLGMAAAGGNKEAQRILDARPRRPRRAQ